MSAVQTQHVPETKSKVHTVIAFIGVICLLVGIFATIRTGLHLTMFKKYPSTGVLTLSFYGYIPYGQREEDCIIYPQTYYTPDGKTRIATEDEKKMEKTQKDNCLSNILYTREMTKMNDIGISLFFLFMGVGILVSKRFIL